MADLSPAAQAVWDAAWNLSPVNCESHEDRRHQQIAAALRALADHQTPSWDGGPTCHWHPDERTRQELRNIAEELERSG